MTQQFCTSAARRRTAREEDEEGHDEWVVCWHLTEEKAFRSKVRGASAPQFASDLEPPEDGDLDAPMVAVWPDGTKDPVYEYTLRDKMAADEAKKTEDKHASASCPVLAEFKRPA